MREPTHQLGMRRTPGARTKRLWQDVLGDAVSATVAGVLGGVGVAAHRREARNAQQLLEP